MWNGCQDRPVVRAQMKVMAMAMASKKRPQIEICSRMETGKRLENHRFRIDAATDYVYLHSLFTRKLLRLQMVD